MYITDDPIADFNRYDREMTRRIEKLPRCRECGEHITDEFAYQFDNEWICEECMSKNHLKEVEEDI